jgi:protein O-mannosyl-transferase
MPAVNFLTARLLSNTLSNMPQSAKKSIIFCVYLALALSIIAVFWQVRNFGFTNYDDNFYVYGNPHVCRGLTESNIIWAFTTGSVSYWHPFTWLSLMLDYQLFGLNPGWMHMENVLLHLANTLLLFAALKKMTGSLWPSAFVAAAFALHPMHVESVAWITERKDVLSTFFLMLTLACYIRCVERPSIFRYSLVLAIFAIGLMTKPMLVTLPFVLLLLDYWPLKRKISRLLLIEKIPFFILSVVSSVITFLVQDRSGTVSDLDALPFKFRIANIFLSYTRYIGKMFWPKNLAVFYPFDVDSFSFWQIILCALFLFAISVIVFRLRKNYGCLPTGWFWFLGTLIPVIGIIQAGSQSYADRYTYIPYIGLFIMIAWGLPQLLSKWRHRKIIFAVSMLTALTIFGISARKQTSYWNNSSTLFSHALKVTNNNFIAHDCLGQDLYQQGKLALAAEHFNKALEIKPNHTNAAINLGCVLTRQGDLDRAIDYFKKALQLEPDSAYALTNLGAALQKQGKFKEAIVQIDRSLRIEPDNPGTKNTLAWLLATNEDPNIRNPSRAVTLAMEACRDTGYMRPGILDTLAAAYASAGKFNDAVEIAQKALILTNRQNQKELFMAIQSRLDLYKNSKPYFEPRKVENTLIK